MSSNAELVRDAFASWEHGSSKAFFRLVSPTVTWRVTGTTPISATYTDRDSFVAATEKLVARLAEPILATVVAVHDCGDTVILEWAGESRGVNGRPYDQRYCWVMRFHEQKIVDATAYLDTALVSDMFAG